MKTILSWSGGKDSTASLILAYENKIKIDEVIFSEVMWEGEVSGENPSFIKWVYETAIPKIKSMGFKVIVLRNKTSAKEEMNKRVTRSKHPDRIGKKHGMAMAMGCFINGKIKIKNIHDYLKNQKEPYQQIIGIAVDEERRLNKMKEGQISLLKNFNVKESDTFEICKKYDLLNPIYSKVHRGGCWFCPNQGIQELTNLYIEHRNLFNELEKIVTDPETVHPGFLVLENGINSKKELLITVGKCLFLILVESTKNVVKSTK